MECKSVIHFSDVELLSEDQMSAAPPYVCECLAPGQRVVAWRFSLQVKDIQICMFTFRMSIDLESKPTE